MAITGVGARTLLSPLGALRAILIGLVSFSMAQSASANSTLSRTVVALSAQAPGQVLRRGLQVRPLPVNQAKEKEAAEKDKKPDKKLDLEGWIQRLLNRPAPQMPRPGALPGTESPDGRSNDRDAVDSRAPHDLKVEQMMRAAEQAMRRKEWKTAQELLQRLLDLPEDSLYRHSDGRWQSVRRTANQLLGNAPKQFLDDYRTQYSGLAQQLLNEAKRTGRTSDYVSVATRFLHTPAGYEAANYLGSLHFDRGEFGLATSWFDEISRSSAAMSTDAAWRVKAALASRQAGNLAASQKLLDSFGEPPANRVNLGLGNVEPGAWVGGTTAALPGRALVLGEWMQLYGSPSRLGTSTGSEPLLAPLWNVQLTSSHTVRKKLSWILQDLLDQGKIPIVAAMPLVVGGRVIYRDLRGVRAVDIESGKTLWESLEGVSPERILGGMPAQQFDGREAWRFRVQFQQDFNEYQGQSAEYHPLASLLFRDGVYGVVSSDGQQVFVIEDHGILSRNQPGQHWGWDGGNEQQDPYGVPWKTNRLVSYDLKTGRPRWSVGGTEALESFDLPLAGSFFYGTPTIDGEELLVVAGKGDDVRLWSLDRATGTPRWSQLIAYTDTKIEQDIGRRWFTAQVATDGGVIVCPTTVGWLVAVDRLRQSVLWAHRFVPPSGTPERDSSMQFIPQRELSSQWSPSAPVISGSTVVYTPPEEPLVVALNLLDGKKLWQLAKDQWLYLAGVFGDRVVLVGASDVGAFNLTTGKPIWTAHLDTHPSGRGQAVEDQYYLPLTSGELRVIDLKTGKKISHGFVPPTHPALGNLAMHRGKLVSLGPQGLVGFGQRDAVMAEIQRRKGLNPQDPWALLREAEIHLLNREYSSALPLLMAISTEGLTTDERSRRHSELVECLASVIRQDPKSHLQELQELGRLADKPNEKRLHQELTADQLVAQSKFLEAFDILWSLKGTGDADSLVARGDDPQVLMSPRVWLSGRLMELWTASAAADREQVDKRVTAVVAEARGADVASRRLVAALLGFHPAAVPLRESLIEDLATAGDFGGAQLELLKLTSSADQTIAAKATIRMARLMEQFQMPADAAYYYQLLEREFGDVTVSDDGVTGAQLVKLLRSEGKVDRGTKAKGPVWDERPLQLVQGPVQYTPPSQEISLHSPLPFFEPLGVEVRQQEQRLAFELLENGQFSWLAPLRSSPRNQGDGYTATQFLGHEVVLINRDVLHVFSPVEKKLMWSTTLDGSGEGGPFWRHASRPPQLAMASSRNSDQQLSLLQLAAYTGRMAVVQPNYICVYGRRSISVLDPRTGEFLWRKEGIPQYAQVIGNRDMICVVPQNRDNAEAFRTSDGKVLKVDRLGTLLGNTLQLHEDSLLLLEQGSASPYSILNFFSSYAKTVLRLHQPLTSRDRWKLEFPAGSLVSAVDDDELLVVPPDGKAERVTIATGKRTPLESIPLAELKARRPDSYALADDDHIYFIANVQDTAGFHHYGESLPSIRVNGVIYAWNKSDGKLAWRQDVKNQNLVVDRFRSIPLLLFVSRSWKQKGNMSYGTLSVQAIHKQSGKILHDTPAMPSMYSGFHSLDINLSEPSIELRSYNLRMRLVPTDGPVAEAKPEPKPGGEPATKN